jgi:hypothetical protein
MFDRSEIMKAAWESYRELNRRYADWQREKFEDIRDFCSFSACLRFAWRVAKETLAAVRMATLAAANPRIAAIQRQIHALTYDDTGRDIARDRRELESRIDLLLAA